MAIPRVGKIGNIAKNLTQKQGFKKNNPLTKNKAGLNEHSYSPILRDYSSKDVPQSRFPELSQAPSIELNNSIPKFEVPKNPTNTLKNEEDDLVAFAEESTDIKLNSNNSATSTSSPKADSSAPANTVQQTNTSTGQSQTPSNTSATSTDIASEPTVSAPEPHTGTVGESSSSSTAPTTSTSAPTKPQKKHSSLSKSENGLKGSKVNLDDKSVEDEIAIRRGLAKGAGDEYHIGRVSENLKTRRADINSINENDINKLKKYATDNGLTVEGDMTRDKLLKAADNHARERLRAGADWMDNMMGYNIPQYAVALGTTATLAANVLSSNGHKSNAELYSSPY